MSPVYRFQRNTDVDAANELIPGLYNDQSSAMYFYMSSTYGNPVTTGDIRGLDGNDREIFFYEPAVHVVTSVRCHPTSYLRSTKILPCMEGLSFISDTPSYVYLHYYSTGIYRELRGCRTVKVYIKTGLNVITWCKHQLFSTTLHAYDVRRPSDWHYTCGWSAPGNVTWQIYSTKDNASSPVRVGQFDSFDYTYDSINQAISTSNTVIVSKIYSPPSLKALSRLNVPERDCSWLARHRVMYPVCSDSTWGHIRVSAPTLEITTTEIVVSAPNSVPDGIFPNA